MRAALVLNPSKEGWERALEAVVAAAQAAGRCRRVKPAAAAVAAPIPTREWVRWR